GVCVDSDLFNSAEEAKIEWIIRGTYSEHTFTGVIARTPKVIAVVCADCTWKPVLGAVKINCSGIHVSVCKYCSCLTLADRDCGIRLCDSLGHALPSEFIGK